MPISPLRDREVLNYKSADPLYIEHAISEVD